MVTDPHRFIVFHDGHLNIFGSRLHHLQQGPHHQLDGTLLCGHSFLGVVLLQKLTHGFGTPACGIGLSKADALATMIWNSVVLTAKLKITLKANILQVGTSFSFALCNGLKMENCGAGQL